MARGPIPDKPANRPTVRDVVPLVEAFYGLPGCGVGGALHIVLDDANLDDDSIQWCMDTADEHWSQEPECAKLLGRILLQMTKTQRRKLADAHMGDSGVKMPRAELIENLTALVDRTA